MNAVAQTPGKAKRDREILTASERLTEPISIVVMLLLFSFFVYHQAADTGFFTDRFGPVEMFFLYGPLLLSALAPIIRAATGRRNLARPAEVITNLFLAAAAAWFLVVFPFDFMHLADALPEGLQFLLAWVTNDIGRITLILQLIVAPLVALGMLWTFISVLSRGRASGQS